MGKKRIVLRVTISDKKKCKKEILSAVGKISGIDKLDMDADKGTLTVVGEVEPVPIFKALKKIGKSPEIVNVGPPRPVRCGPNCPCSSCSSYYDHRETWWQQSSYPSKSFCNSDCNKSCCKQQGEIITLGYPLSPDHHSGKCAIM